MDEPTSPPKRKRGCCFGCTVTALGLVALTALAVVFGPQLLRAVGVMQPDAETLFSGSPDRLATDALNESLADFEMDGVEAMVLPIAGTDGQLAHFSIDMEAATVGGLQTTTDAEAWLKDLARQMADQNESLDLNIEHVAMDFDGPDGQSLVSVTAPIGVFEAYAAGTITREQFAAELDVDLGNLLDLARQQGLLEDLRRSAYLRITHAG